MSLCPDSVGNSQSFCFQKESSEIRQITDSRDGMEGCCPKGRLAQKGLGNSRMLQVHFGAISGEGV